MPDEVKILKLNSELFDLRYLKLDGTNLSLATNLGLLYLDQSTPQTISGGAPIFDAGLTSNGIVSFVPSTLQSITAAGGIAANASHVRVQGNGGPVDITASPQISAGTVDGQLLTIEGYSDTNTVLIEDGTGVHVHGGDAKLRKGDIILFYWDSTESEWEETSRNFNRKIKGVAFTSPAGGSGTYYFSSHYKFGSAANDFNPSITFGNINASRAAHFFLVQAAGASGGTDTVIRVTGTSITDAGVRTASDTQDLTVDDAGAAGTYYETTKKWLGRVTIAKISGPDLLCNYGFCKYWDNNNTNFRVVGVEATFLAGANDTAPNISILHHKATGWTYNAGAAPTPPTPIATMNTDHVTEIELFNGENGAWKRDNLTTSVDGSGGEGIVFRIKTTANKAFEFGNIELQVRPG